MARAAVALAALSAFPLFWMALASVVPESTLFDSAALWRGPLVLDHYRALATERAFWVPIRNSVVVAGATTLFAVAVGGACAYALARLRFRGRYALLAFVLAVSMFPQISLVAPLYLLLR
jgi:ABC-type glycerol-3-phosphate transport system permease component